MGPELVSRLYPAMAAAVRGRGRVAASGSGRHARCMHASSPPAIMTRPPCRSQAVRTLSQPTRPGGHPLRALRTGAAQPVLPAREWASISALADPVAARDCAVYSMVAEWQWTPLPAAAAFARVVTASGILGLLTRLLLVAGAHAERCAWRAPAPVPHAPPAARSQR